MPLGHVGRLGYLGALVAFGAWLPAVAGAARTPPELSVTLGYEVDPGLRGCPTESEFRSAVSDQLGYDPFRSASAHRVVASVQESERGIDGQVTWTDAAGQ